MNPLFKVFRFAPFLAICLSAQAQLRDHDYRMVNNRTVDLGPIHRWLESRRGERPMKFWKVCHMYEMKTYTVQADQCVLVGEDGLMMRVYLMHLDAPIRDPFVSLIDANQTIAELTQQVRDDQGVVSGLAGNGNKRFQADRDAAVRRLADERPTLNQAINTRNMLLAPNGPIDMAKRAPFLAMDIGATTKIPETGAVASYWDCGRKVPAPPPETTVKK